MPVKLTFASPVNTAPTAAEAKVVMIYKRRDPWVIAVEVTDETGRLREFRITNTLAETLIKALNKSNNSTAGNSEEQRILNWLQNNVNPDTGANYLPAGTYSGVPD